MFPKIIFCKFNSYCSQTFQIRFLKFITLRAHYVFPQKIWYEVFGETVKVKLQSFSLSPYEENSYGGYIVNMFGSGWYVRMRGVIE